jgi:hypothetical protein
VYEEKRAEAMLVAFVCICIFYVSSVTARRAQQFRVAAAATARNAGHARIECNAFYAVACIALEWMRARFISPFPHTSML